MTGARWPSAFAAALFAFHPLHVESVAWVAERKDVLSTLFWLLTMWAYARYVERLCGGWYALSLTLFAMGLAAKPMLVTLPFVLLLLDYWPLGRILGPARSTFVRLFLEKVPFLILSAASSVVTFLVQRKWGAVASATEIPRVDRLANAAVAYGGYLWKMVWPSKLAFFYPLPHERPLLQVVLAALVMIALSAMVFRGMRRHPYLATGWGWYLGTLVPVIGLVQVGDQAMADRYTYVPLIGLFLIIAWGGAELLEKRRVSYSVAAMASVGLLLACMVDTWFQVGYWKNSITLFEHALRVTENNYLAHASLGLALAEPGRLDEAIVHYGEALQINPNYSPAQAGLGFALAQKGKIAEAIVHYREALRLRPNRIEVLNNLAWLLATSRDPKFRSGAEAVDLAEKACGLTGYRNANYLDTLAAAHAEAGRSQEAVSICEKAVALALASGEVTLARTIEARMKLYRSGQAYRE
jgi:Tfp pilus assembly protein PilF